MKEKLALVARILLGLIFLVFGLNGFFQFIPMSVMPPMAEPGMAFMGALANTGYMIPLIKIFEIIAGILFLSGFYVPLGLIIITPGLYNILLFHVFLAPAPQSLALAILMVLLHAYLVHMYWSYYCDLLICKPEMDECCDHDHHDHHHGHSHK